MINKKLIDTFYDTMRQEAKTADELHQMLSQLSYMIGGMVCHFEGADRPPVLMSLTESMAMGLMNTSKSLGEQCDVQIVIGNDSRTK